MPESLSGEPTETDMPLKQNEKPEDAIKRLDAELAKANFLAKLSDAQKKAYEDMSDEEKEEFDAAQDKDKPAFLDKMVAKQSDANPIVYTAANGDVFRKNDDPRLAKMARERDADRKAASEAAEKAANATYAKRAGDELPNLPGDEATKVAVLKAVDGIADEAVRKSAAALLKAGNDAMTKAFDRAGIGGGKSPEAASATAKIDELTKAEVAKSQVSYAQAYEKVLKTKEGADLYAQSVAAPAVQS